MDASKKVPSVDYLHECFSYYAKSGLAVWKVRPRDHFNTEHGCRTFNCKFAGKIVGSKSRRDGYIRVYMKKSYLLHRVIWALHHGEWPEAEVDHINGDRADNRIANLRAVSKKENRQNAKRRSDNTSSVVGVYWSPKWQKWYAQINDGVARRSLGYYENFDDAVIARKEAERRLGYHENHGRAA